MEKSAPIPKSLKGILWSKDIGKIDLAKDKVYLVNQVLMYGNLDHLRWLFHAYPKAEVIKVFLESPLPIYTKPAFKFIKEFILGIRDVSPDPRRYVKSLY